MYMTEDAEGTYSFEGVIGKQLSVYSLIERTSILIESIALGKSLKVSG